MKQLLFPLLSALCILINNGQAQSPESGASSSETSPGASATSASREEAARPQPSPRFRDAGIELEHADGRSVLGPAPLDQLRLLGSGTERQLSFGGQSWPVADALFLRFPHRRVPAEKQAWIVLLRNGDAVLAKVVAPPQDDSQDGDGDGNDFDPDQLRLRLTSLGGQEVRAPLAAITALIAETSLYGRPGRLLDYPQAKAQLIRRLRRLEVEEDVVLLRRSSESSGPQGTRVEGIVERFANDGLTISSDRLGEVEVGYDAVKAVVLAQLDNDDDDEEESDGASGLRVQLRFHDGSSLVGRLETLGGSLARVHHESLGELDVALERLSEIAFLDGRVTYLSDREPTNVREIPGPLFNTTGRYGYKRDTNVLYGPLRMGGRVYRKGLGVHSYSLLEYALRPDDVRFRATIGLDDSARPFSSAVAATDVASVVFRVKVDGKLLFQKAMSWKDPPVPIEVPLKGDKLSLEVDFGGVPGSMNSTLDRANWADARLVKNAE